MNAAQVLICRAPEVKSYQSVMNWYKKVKYPYKAVDNACIQLLHDGNNHWLLTFCSNGRVQVCDTLRTNLSRFTWKSVNSIYGNSVNNAGKISDCNGTRTHKSIVRERTHNHFAKVVK